MTLPRPTLALYRYIPGWVVAGLLTVSLVGFAGKWSWYADLYNQLRPQYLIAFVAIFALGFWRRRWKLVAASGLGFGINLAVLLPHGLAPSTPYKVTTEPETLEVATINLLRRNQNHDALRRLLRERLPDVVVFQEVSGEWVNVLQGLKDIYPHQRMEFHRKGFWGLAILSRVPWTQAELLRLGTGPTKVGMAIEFEFRGRKVNLLDIHASHPTSANEIGQRKVMHQAITDWSDLQRKAGHAVIVAGDFNCTPWAQLFKDFLKQSGLLDTSQGRVFEATRHLWLPDRILIDHIFVSPDWTVTGREVGPEIGSDHRPVFVSLEPK